MSDNPRLIVHTNNQRVAKLIDGQIVEKYLWENLTTLLAIYNADDSLKQRFEYATQRMPISMSMGSEKYYLHYDQVGSLRAVSDSSHTLIKEIVYDSFGNILSDTNTDFKVPFGFAGGLYDAFVGKWTAKDPIGFEGGDSNLYGYVLGDGVNFVDPSGLIGFKDIFTSGWDEVKEKALITCPALATGNAECHALIGKLFEKCTGTGGIVY